ncbi:MAG: HEAT repeat domain-containing protein [Aggregatilineales bacterium]
MSSPIKRLVQYHIKRLSDKNPDVRIKAIKELELIADTDALDVLRSVFENDDNAEVRSAAKQAGRTIFLKTSQTN